MNGRELARAVLVELELDSNDIDLQEVMIRHLGNFQAYYCAEPETTEEPLTAV